MSAEAAPVSVPTRTTPSGFTTSVLGFGCWQLACKGEDDYWGLDFNQELADTLIGRATASGITYFDTAEGYSDGASEVQLGASLKALEGGGKTRADFVVGSKISPNNCASADLEAHLQATLDRLGTEVRFSFPAASRALSHSAAQMHTTHAARALSPFCRSPSYSSIHGHPPTPL